MGKEKLKSEKESEEYRMLNKYFVERKKQKGRKNVKISILNCFK